MWHAAARVASDEEIAELFRGTRSRRERLRRLVDDLFGLYERGGDVLWAPAPRARPASAPPSRSREDRGAPRRAYHHRARAVRARGARARGGCALTDYDAWTALRERGIAGPDAVDVVAGLLEGWLR